MTSPVTTAVATAARPAPGGDAGGTDSAEPFATALDGALTSGRPEVDGTGPDGSQGGSSEEEPAAEGAPATAADAVPAAGTGVVAALWARLTGAVADAQAGEAGAAAGTPGRAESSGRAHALATAGGVAHGLHGTQPGHVAGLPVPGGATPVPAPPVPTPPAPGTGPTPPPPAAAVADAADAADAVATLAAVGLELVVAGPAGDAPTTAVPTAVAPPAQAPVTEDAAVPGTGTGSTVPAPALVQPGPGADAGTDGRADGGATDGTPGETTAVTGPTGAPATTSTAPASRADAAAGPTAGPPVAGQLARSVAVLRGGPDGTHTMTVVLTPEALGPVEVSVTLSHGSVELTLRGAHDHGRAALVDALPDLRRDLEAAGLTCSRVEVDRGNRDGAFSAQQQAAGRDAGGGRGQHSERGDTGARPWHRPADNGEGRPAATRTATGLDVRV
jgi:flagellar hook-length control protein FliK